MEIKGQIFVGFDEKPYIHIYRDGKGVMESVRVSLYDDDWVGISPSSKRVWRDWVNEAYDLKNQSPAPKVNQE